KSDVPTQLTALLRNREELLDTYTRRVWKCRQGYFLDGDTCIAIDESNIGRFACSDDNDQIIPSSPLNPFLKKAMEPGGPLDGTPFSKLTNRRLACCTSVGL